MSNGSSREKGVADASIAFGAGLASIIFSAQFLDIPKSVTIAVVLLVIGLGGIFWATWRWRRV